jgi:hypothetical protein
VHLAFPVYHLYVGRLPELPWFKLSAADDEFFSLIAEGDPSGRGWDKFLAKHGNRWTKQQVYSAVSSIVLAGTLTALVVAHIDHELDRFAAEDRELKEKSDQTLKAEEARTAEIVAEVAILRERSVVQDALEHWIFEFRKENGADPDTTGVEYQAVKKRYRELLAE